MCERCKVAPKRAPLDYRCRWCASCARIEHSRSTIASQRRARERLKEIAATAGERCAPPGGQWEELMRFYCGIRTSDRNVNGQCWSCAASYARRQRRKVTA